MSVPRGDGTWTIKGADGNQKVLGKGEWYVSAKARPRRMMKNSLSKEARQIYACLELGTMGFSQEPAVIMKDGREVPMTFAYIAEQTGLRRQHIHDRYWPELENAGLAGKRPRNADLPLQQGNIELISWAEPRAPKTKSVPARGYRFPEWAPSSWADPESTVGRFLKRHKIEFQADFVPARGYTDEVEAAAREYEKAENSLRALLDLSHAPNAYKDERKERNIERNKLASPVPPSPPTPEEICELQEHLDIVAEQKFHRFRTSKKPNPQTCVNIIQLARGKHPTATPKEIAAGIAEWALNDNGYENWGGVVNLLKKAWSADAATTGGD